MAAKTGNDERGAVSDTDRAEAIRRDVAAKLGLPLDRVTVVIRIKPVSETVVYTKDALGRWWRLA